jgi:hypothetical protein
MSRYLVVMAGTIPLVFDLDYRIEDAHISAG